MASWLAERGVAVVSGLAEGVDTAEQALACLLEAGLGALAHGLDLAVGHRGQTPLAALVGEQFHRVASEGTVYLPSGDPMRNLPGRR